MICRRAHHLSLTFIFCLLLISGCKYKGNLWGDVHNFPGNEWEQDQKVTFVPDSVLVSKGADRVALFFRYGADMPYQQIPMLVEIESPTDSLGYYVDTLTFSFPRDNSRFAVLESCDTLQFPLKVQSGWAISILPLVPDGSIEDFYSVGLTVLENDFQD